MSFNLSLSQFSTQSNSPDNPEKNGTCVIYDVSDLDFSKTTVNTYKDLSFITKKTPLDSNLVVSGIASYNYDITPAVKAALSRMKEGDTTASLTLAITATPKEKGGYRIFTYTKHPTYKSYVSYLTGEYYDNGEVLTEIARAYDRKGGKVQYDQGNHGAKRRYVVSSPEDATAQKTIYLDCSSYVNACYREAFGVNIMPYTVQELSPSTKNYSAYAKANQNNVDVIGYWEPSDYDTEAERTALAQSIISQLEVGDILNYRHGKTADNTAGHVYMYIGNGTFIHCQAGNSYYVVSENPALSYESTEGEATDGRIFTITNENIFANTESNRYIFKITDSDTVQNFCLLRPLNRGLTLTDKAKSRMRIAGLNMEKTASVYENSSVKSGDLLTYTITLQNTKSSVLNNVVILDTLPEGTEFVSGSDGINVTGNKLKWIGNINGSSTLEVSYTLRVTASTPGKLIISNDTYVSGIKLGKLIHTVSKYPDASESLIKDVAESIASKEMVYENSLSFAKDVYKKATGIDLLSEYDTVEAVLDNIIDVENLTYYNNTDISQFLVPNLYGGLDIQNGTYLIPDSERTRLVTEGNLSVGDVILAEWSGGNRIYIYTGNSTLVLADEAGEIKKLTIGDNIFGEGADNILVSLIAYDRFAVLRPSMLNVAPTVNVSSVEITNLPDKMKYTNGDTFDPDGMIVTATFSNGETREITEYTVSPEKFSYPDNVVTVSYGGKTASFEVELSEFVNEVNVSDIDNYEIGSYFKVKALVVGVAYDGDEGTNELLLKDLATDDLISLRNIPYGTIHNYGYTKGDEVSIFVNLRLSDSIHTSNKKYLEFSETNGTIDTTIISQGNVLGFKLDNVVVLDTWADMQEFFDIDTIKPYTYVKITEDFYINYYSKGVFYRPHKNASANSLTTMKPDAVRSICLRDDVTTKNLGSEWTKLFFEERSTSQYPGTHVESKEFYAIYTGATTYYYQLIIPERSWVTDVSENE